jgi:Protein of unknown function (DUF998)
VTSRKGLLVRISLMCGVVSSLLYVAMNVFVALQWEGYSSVSQTVSELSAIGAPTRPLWVTLAIAYTALVAAFGWGVLQSAGQTRSLRIVGWLVVANATPYHRHPRSDGATLRREHACDCERLRCASSTA